jgi:hypothetical protein
MLEASQDIETNKHLCNQGDKQDTHTISDGEEELSNEHEQSQDIFRPHEPAPNDKASDTYAAAEKHNEMREENLTNFTDNLTEKPVHMIDDTDKRLLAADNPQAELLRWHYRLRHISFAIKTLHPCSARNHPKEANSREDSKMCRLHEWSHDETTLENKSTTR